MAKDLSAFEGIIPIFKQLEKAKKYVKMQKAEAFKRINPEWMKLSYINLS